MTTIPSFTIRKLDEKTAGEIARWQYDPPYDVYSFDPGKYDETLRWLLTPQYQYYGAWNDQGEVIGYCCFGEDARVPGGDYAADALDIGVGLRPDLTGKGLGVLFMQAVIAFAREQFEPAALRVTVMAFNTRALRVYNQTGFRQNQEFLKTNGRGTFFILMREADL